MSDRLREIYDRCDVSNNAVDGMSFEEFKQAIEAEADKARRGEYIIHEVHGVGGRTINGETLYWAKVRKATHLNTQESEDTDE